MPSVDAWRRELLDELAALVDAPDRDVVDGYVRLVGAPDVDVELIEHPSKLRKSGTVIVLLVIGAEHATGPNRATCPLWIPATASGSHGASGYRDTCSGPD